MPLTVYSTSCGKLLFPERSFPFRGLTAAKHKLAERQVSTGRHSEYFVSGYAWAEDKEHCEEYGRMLQADPDKVSPRAKKRGLPQVNELPS